MKKFNLILLLILGSFAGAKANLSPDFQQQENPHVTQIQPSPISGSSKAVIVDEAPLVHTTQLHPLNKRGKLMSKKGVSGQVKQLFKNIDIVLKEANSKADNIIKINVCISRDDIMPELTKQLSRKFSKGIKPAVSFVRGDLAHPGADVAMDVIATTDLHTSGKVEYFHSKDLYDQSAAAHASILPAGGVTYVSGLADAGNLTEATRGTLKQLDATLKQLGISKEQVIQIKSFMRPMTDVSAVEKELALFFEGRTIPPVVYVEWLSENPVIEIELIAASPNISNTSEQLSFITPAGMKSSPVFSRVAQINHGKKIYVSGLYGITLNDPKAQTSEIFASLKEILTLAGSDFTQLAKATYYVSDNQASISLNGIRPEFYDPKRPPAASKAMVKGHGMSGISISIDMIGVVR